MLVAHLKPKTVVYTEVCVLRRAMRFEGENASDYAMRLRGLAKHCEFKDVDREILEQFIIGTKRPDVERKCCRTDKLDLTKAIEIATNFENLEANLNGLHAPTEREIGRQGINKIEGQGASWSLTQDRPIALINKSHSAKKPKLQVKTQRHVASAADKGIRMSGHRKNMQSLR